MRRSNPLTERRGTAGFHQQAVRPCRNFCSDFGLLRLCWLIHLEFKPGKPCDAKKVA